MKRANTLRKNDGRLGIGNRSLTSILRNIEDKDEVYPYRVYFGWQKESERKEQVKKNNNFRGAKYNKCNCIPKALFREVIKPLNLYFIIVAALSYTAYAPTEPIQTTLTVIIYTILIVAREIMDDIRQQKVEKLVN